MKPGTPEYRRAQLYEEAVGREAAERQKWAAVDRHLCCGERLADGHHEACSNRPADPPAEVHPGQEALA